MKKKNKAQQRKLTVNPVQAELEYLISFLGSISSVSEFLGASNSTVAKWFKGTAVPNLESETKIVGLRYVILRLSSIYLPETIKSWLKGTHITLNHCRPIDLLKRGRIIEVLCDIEHAATGSYA